MKYAVLSVIIAASLHMCGQEQNLATVQQSGTTIPDSPSASKQNISQAKLGAPVPRTLGGTPPVLALESAIPQRPSPVIDGKFALFTLVQFAAAVGDVESTEYGLARGGTEANPLVGWKPSRAKLYAISMPINVGIAVWSYKLKKKARHSMYWAIPPLVSGAIHSGVAVHNLGQAGR